MSYYIIILSYAHILILLYLLTLFQSSFMLHKFPTRCISFSKNKETCIRLIRIQWTIVIFHVQMHPFSIQCAARNPATVPFCWLHLLRSFAFFDFFAMRFSRFWEAEVVIFGHFGSRACCVVRIVATKMMLRKRGCRAFSLQRSVLCGSRCLWFLSELAA